MPNYIAVRGKGNPNDESGEYKDSIGLLYAIAFTIKMSYKGSHKIEGITVMVGSFFIGFHKLIKTATSVAIGNDMPLANFIIKCLTTNKNSSILWLIKEIEIRVSILLKILRLF